MKISILCLGLFLTSYSFAKNDHVIIETSAGEIEVELFNDKAPNTVKNFLSYVDKKFYNETIFHRIINNFMIQGGGFDKDFKQKQTSAPIKNEANNGLSNTPGTLAMARTNDPDSATAQFFINVAENQFLDHKAPNDAGWGYAVFGKVTNGMHVVNRLKTVKTGSMNGHQDVPMDTVIIKAIRRKK